MSIKQSEERIWACDLNHIIEINGVLVCKSLYNEKTSSFCSMANQEQLNILSQGTNAWNKWRTENPERDIDLTGADLSGFDLHGISFNKANLSDANLSRSDLHNSIISSAYLCGADLSDANLRWSDLNGAILDWANLNRADSTKQISLFRIFIMPNFQRRTSIILAF